MKKQSQKKPRTRAWRNIFEVVHGTGSRLDAVDTTTLLVSEAGVDKGNLVFGIDVGVNELAERSCQVGNDDQLIGTALFN